MKSLLLSVVLLGLFGQTVIGIDAGASPTGTGGIFGVRRSKNIFGMRGGKPNLSSGKLYNPQGRSLGHNYFGSVTGGDKNLEGSGDISAARKKPTWGYWDDSIDNKRAMDQKRFEGSIGDQIVKF